MSTADGPTVAFANELDNLVERFRKNWDIEYAQVVGVLMMKVHLLHVSAMEEDEEEESE